MCDSACVDAESNSMAGGDHVFLNDDDHDHDHENYGESGHAKFRRVAEQVVVDS